MNKDFSQENLTELSAMITYKNITRGHLPELAAIRKAVQWGGTWATLQDDKGEIYSVGVTTSGCFNNLGSTEKAKPATLLCLADSRDVDHLEVYWPEEAQFLSTPPRRRGYF